jgi:dipeptidyl aminopeptidase/acylaminoacyl peptidase
MAARPLASAGIMVLQIPDNHAKDDITLGEAERHVEGFRSAIEQLTSDGLIDPKRVGVVGFSRTCWYVETALIERPTMFAAATIADGVDMSYMQFHLSLQHDLIGEFEKINQAKPFGDGLKKWIESAPGFNLDKVKTPLRIEALNRSSVLAEWEIYSSLRIMGTPVDLIYFPRGQHILQKPLDRLASQQGNVDWFQFWLEGNECHEPNRETECRRWEMMRDTKPIDSKKAGPIH